MMNLYFLSKDNVEITLTPPLTLNYHVLLNTEYALALKLERESKT